MKIKEKPYSRFRTDWGTGTILSVDDNYVTYRYDTWAAAEGPYKISKTVWFGCITVNENMVMFPVTKEKFRI